MSREMEIFQFMLLNNEGIMKIYHFEVSLAHSSACNCAI